MGTSKKEHAGRARTGDGARPSLAPRGASKAERAPEQVAADPGPRNGGLADSAPNAFDAILRSLEVHTDYDFGCYKKGMLTRRLERRMSLRHTADVEEYLGYLQTDPEEIRLLARDMLLGVTRFFRENEAWAELENEVLGRLVQARSAHDPIRAWVAGCASGEEAYTLAMLLSEQRERLGGALEFQVFATDIDADSLETARKGAYPRSIAADVSASRLERFFTEEGEELRASKGLRGSIVFAMQNLLRDPPLSRLDLVTCRNVLIYLEPDVQRRLLEVFHFALNDGGYLFLGKSETVKSGRLFHAVEGPSRIYRKVGPSTHGRDRVSLSTASRPVLQRARPGGATVTLNGPVEAATRALLERFAPASVLVDSRNEIQYQHGPLRNYLDFPSGEPTLDLLAVAAEGLKGHLRALIQTARLEKRPTAGLAPRVHGDGRRRAVRISVAPVAAPKSAEPFVLVSFADEPESGAGTRASSDRKARRSSVPAGPDRDRIARLELELQASREELQSTIEELETSNEELKASNDEVLSANEDLQSTNEELETSREELQSLNEELATVNRQLEENVEELEHTNDDLSNLLTSTDIGTIFLDTELRIRRFTPAATELLKVIEGDVGRPISDLSPRVNDPALVDDARRTIRDLVPIEATVHDGERRWFLRRVRPYRTAENRIHGVVITFADVTRLKETTDELERRERRQAMVAKLGAKALSGAPLDELFEAATRMLRDALDVELVRLLESRAEGVGFSVRSTCGDLPEAPTDFLPGGRLSQAGYTLLSAGTVLVEDLSAESRFETAPSGAAPELLASASVVVGPPERPWGVLEARAASRGHFGEDHANTLQAVAHVLFEAVERKRSEEALERKFHEISMLHRVSVLAAETDSLETVLQGCIDTVCELAGWPVGHAFVPSRDGARLVSSGVWHVDSSSSFDRLRAASADVAFARDEGLIGRIWSTGRPEWVEDVQLNHDFKRSRVDKELGVRGAFGFPIKIGEETVAVLEFFSSERQGPDTLLMQIVSSLGEQVGRVVERQRARAEIALSEQRLRLAVGASALGTFEFDPPSGRNITSEAHDRIIQGDVGEEPLTYELWLERVHPEDRARVAAQFQRALDPDGDGEYEAEYRVQWKDGSTHWVAVTGRALFETLEGRRQATCILGTVRDVTRRKENEQYRTLLASVVESSADAIVSKSLDGTVTSWNPAAERMYGYTAEEIVGQPVEKLIPDDLRGDHQGIFERVRRGERIEPHETRRRRKDGTMVDVSLSLSPALDERGRVVGVAAIARDITEEKRSREELARSRQWLERIAAASPDTIVVHDVVARTNVYWNQRLVELLGYKPEELSEMSPGAAPGFLHPDDLTAQEVIYQRLDEWAEGEVRELTYRSRHRDGSVRWVEVRAVPFSRDDGRIREVLAVARDVTRLKLAEGKLIDADRRKDEFLAMLAHELRNPLAAMRNGVALLRMRRQEAGSSEEPSPESLQEMLARQTDQLKRLVDDLLEVERISQGKITLRRLTCSVPAAIEDAVQGVRETAASRRQELVVTPPETPLYAELDPGRFAQVLGNLLDNAVKYTNVGGRIELSAELRDGEIEIRCRDNGRGMTPEALERVFEPFTQVDPALDRRGSGLGIGLALVRKLTELHGGVVRASSEGLGQGSEFVVTLPAVPPPASEPSPPQPAARTGTSRRTGLKVLVVDDNVDFSRSLAQALEAAGQRVRVAHDGPTGLELATTETPDVILLDVGLPGMDGIELARRVRSRSSESKPWIVAVSGYGNAPDSDANALLDAYLVKPVEVDDLLSLLDSLARVDPSCESLRILLVEDHEQLGRVTAELLRKRGHRVDLATRGEEAIRVGSDASHDLVLCDLSLPDMSGVEVARRLRELPNQSAVFVALSAHDRETLEQQAGEIFDLHIPKPLDWNALSTALRSLDPR